MKLKINEAAKLSGVSVRTLHYYDEIGLLSPGGRDENNGYRYYDEKAMQRLQEIMFYRELDFPLKRIAEILTSTEYKTDKAVRDNALSEQKQLLILKKQRLERLIDALDSIKKGDADMNFKAFDNTEYEEKRKEYEREAEQKWGKTDAFAQNKKKTAGYIKEKWNEVNSGLDNIFEELAACMKSGEAPESNAARALVKKLQEYISNNFYDCTNEIFAGLGQMYTADERFKENIDTHGEGAAAFVSKAISDFCRKT